MKSVVKNISLGILTMMIACTFFSCHENSSVLGGDDIPIPKPVENNPGGSGIDSDSANTGNSGTPGATAGFPDVSTFPGEIADDVPRVSDYEVNVSLNYNAVAENLRIDAPAEPQFGLVYMQPHKILFKLRYLME